MVVSGGWTVMKTGLAGCGCVSGGDGRVDRMAGY